MESKIKTHWPDWQVVSRIGTGNFGSVYEIQRNNFGNIEKAALKVISIPKDQGEIESLYSNGFDNASVTTRFHSYLENIVREYSLMREMKGYTNVVCCDDIKYVPHEDGIGWDIFIKMERLIPLTRTINMIDQMGEKQLEDQTILLGMDICTALSLCKKRNIIHRDIKPQNILLSKDGDYKLADFGVAKTVEQTVSGTTVGTYSYMAPEVYKHEPYNATVDVYSLGLLMYWMLNERRLPFLPLPPANYTANMETEARERRLLGETIPVPAHGGSALHAIILKACAYTTDERYSSAEEMFNDLRELAQQRRVARITPEDDRRETEMSGHGTISIFSKYRISFDTNGHGAAPEEQTIVNKSGGLVKRPPDPTASGVVFDGWYEEKECVTRWKFDSRIVTENVTLYAKWVEEESPKPPILVLLREKLAGLTNLLSPIKTFVTKNKKVIPIAAAVLVFVLGGTLLISGLGTNEVPSDDDAEIQDTETPDTEVEAPEQQEQEEPEQEEPPVVQLSWSEWMEELPADVLDGGYLIETKTQYRSAEKHFFDAETPTEEGYTVYSTSYGDWGKWSDWSSTSVEASETREVKTEKRYRYKVWIKTTTGLSSKTSYYKSEWKYSSKRVSGSDIAECQEYTVYSYRTRSRTCYCTKDNGWTEFGDTFIYPTQLLAVNTRTLYRYAESDVKNEAAPSILNFPKEIPSYANRFADVDDALWYGAQKDNWVGTAVHLDVMSTDNYLRFRPEENVTVAEVIKSAVVLRQIYNGEQTIMSKSSPWYNVYVEYAIKNGIIGFGEFTDYTKTATRAEAAYILWHALPETELSASNLVVSITDMNINSKYFKCVYQLAEAGVISWPQPEYAFEPDRPISRAEVAALLCRIAYPEKRIQSGTAG